MVKEKELNGKLEQDLEEDLAKADQKIPPNEMEAYAMSHVLYCLARNYDAAGMGINWGKDTLLRDMIYKSKKYLEQFKSCEDKIREIDLLIISDRKYHLRKK